MSNKTRGRQKKIEKQKKKRELAKREARARAPVVPTSVRAIVRLACEAPFGPAWVSDLTDDSEGAVKLVTVVITKALPKGQLLAQVLLVDRTCLGVKQASLLPPTDERALLDRLAEFGEAGVDLKRCDLVLAQSVVFHALDYANALGFEPHRDFVAAFVGPRPSELVHTPLAHREKPLYVSGPHDNVPGILSRLEVAVGSGNYDFVAAVDMGYGDEADELDDDGCEDCEHDCEGCEGCEHDCEGCDGVREIIDVEPVEVIEGELKVRETVP
jgi:hypothetical protein